MAINERAKTHYDNAVTWLKMSDDSRLEGDINQAICCTGLGNLSLELARFCTEHHALVAGIDESAPIDPRHPPGMGGADVWR
jgi:hypothetical protein